MFMVFMWVVVCLAGSVVQGYTDFARTALTADIAADTTVISVVDTTGFPETGIIILGNEHIAYSHTTANTFHGAAVRPLVRGAEGTTAAVHAAGSYVTTVPGGMLNSSAAYNIAVMADASGQLAFLSVPLAFLRLVGSFFFLPLAFLGTDLQILTVFWAVIGIGMIVAIAIQVIAR